MSSLIRATCPDCGDVEFPTSTALVRVLEAVEVADNRRIVEFVCPQCGGTHTKLIDANLARVLMQYGARSVRIRVPDEARERHEGAPLTLDDAIDFHRQLDGL